MRQVKLVPTIEVWRVSDGVRVVINESDFDGSLYVTEKPVTEQEETPKRGRKAKE